MLRNGRNRPATGEQNAKPADAVQHELVRLQALGIEGSVKVDGDLLDAVLLRKEQPGGNAAELDEAMVKVLPGARKERPVSVQQGVCLHEDGGCYVEGGEGDGCTQTETQCRCPLDPLQLALANVRNGAELVDEYRHDPKHPVDHVE